MQIALSGPIRMKRKCAGTRKSDWSDRSYVSYVSLMKLQMIVNRSLRAAKMEITYHGRLGIRSAQSFGNLKTRLNPITRRSLQISVTRHAFW